MRSTHPRCSCVLGSVDTWGRTFVCILQFSLAQNSHRFADRVLSPCTQQPAPSALLPCTQKSDWIFCRVQEDERIDYWKGAMMTTFSRHAADWEGEAYGPFVSVPQVGDAP